jgi:hypothetical protein
MRDFFVALLSIAVVVLGFAVWTQEQAIQRQGNELHDLSTDKGATTQATALDLQAKCANQADETYKEGGWQGDNYASYSDHYNSALGKCFILIENTDLKTNPNGEYKSESLYDAFELRDYGDYLELTYYDLTKAPVLGECMITQPDGTQASCQTEGEFKKAVEYFMGAGP